MSNSADNNFERPPTVTAEFITTVRIYLQEIDEDFEGVFALADVNESQSSSENMMSIAACSNLFEIAAKKTGDPFFGMNLSGAPFYEITATQLLVMISAPTVEVGLKALSRHCRYLDPAIVAELVVGLDVSKICVQLIDNRNAENRQFNEFLMAGLYRSLNRATRKNVPLEEVRFTHAYSGDKWVYEDFYGAEIKFGQPNSGFVFESWFLKEPFLTASNSLFKVLTESLISYEASGQYDLVEAVSSEVVRISSMEAPTINKVASNLSLAPHTLRRRLKEKGISFNDIKKNALESRAKYLLTETTFSLYNIAIDLGYSELSAFCRAFRNWSGVTPQGFREQSRLD